MKRKNDQHKSGLTLIETLVTTGLFGILILSVYSLLSLANVLWRTNDIYSRLNQSAMQTLRYIAREVAQTSPNTTSSHLDITTDTNSNSELLFQIPVDWDNDGDATSSSGLSEVEWGAYPEAWQTQSGSLNYWIRYRVSGSQLIRDYMDATPAIVSSRVIANNIQTTSGFTCSQSSNTLTMTLVLTATDTVATGSGRTVSFTFQNATMLRNAVS